MDTKKLRQKLLDLAIHGKLVPQDPNDEPASELLARIREEKLAMVERGELKPKDVKGDTVIFTGSDGLPYEKRADGKDVAKCIEEEVPFDLPKGWSWARFGSYLLNKDSERIPVSVADRKELKKIYDYYGASGVIDKVENYLFDKPLLLIGEDGANLVARSTPIAFIARGKYWVNNHAHVLDAGTELQLRYVESYINSINLERYLTGSAQPKLNQDRMNTILIPVPPLPEQRRIVDALDKYLTLVDEIERDRAELDVLLAQLKSKVLDLAVRGELTERDQKDEPASELLARIREDKLAMVARGELKPKDVKGDTVIFTGSDGLRYEKRADGKDEAKCIEKEIPFEVPEGWAWARLGTVCSLLRRGKSPVYTDDASIPVFAQKCNQPWGITLEKVKFLNRSALDRYGETLKLRSGDIVVNSTGTGTLGRVGVFDEGLLGDYPFIVPDSHVAVVRIVQPFESKYIFHLLRSEYGQGLIFSKQTGSTNQKELPAKEIALFLIPVPPLAEQWRIVKRIEKLFNLLD